MVRNNKTGYRAKAIKGLLHAAGKADFKGCRMSAFKALYGLPQKLQIELMIFAMKRYEPIYCSRFKNTEWLTSILEDPHKWFELNGRKFPMPRKTGPADSGFIFSIDALLWACEKGHDKTILASSVGCCIASTIDAMMTNIWQADAPLAVKTWLAISAGQQVSGDEYKNLYGNTMPENAAAIAVGRREWNVVADYLKEKKVSELLDETNKDEIGKGLARWRESEMLLLS